MELPNSTQRQKYINDVKLLENDIKEASSVNSVFDSTFINIQVRLDILAKKYQHEEKMGSARYKLYELQAVIYYFEHKDNEALNFINSAVEIRGSSYPKAERLREKLTLKPADRTIAKINEKKLSKKERRKRLIGLEGWLALFVVGQFLSLIVTFFNLFNGGLNYSSSDVNIYNEYRSGLGDTLRTLITFENIALFTAIALITTTIILLFRRKKLAKSFAIASLIFLTLYSFIDYTVASSVFQSASLTQYEVVSSLINKGAGYSVRNAIAAFIWIPYFLVSKRVKATLIR